MGVSFIVKHNAVFLDRDGVLNQAIIKNGKPYPPRSVDELAVISGVPHALAKLKQAGYLLIGATNQPDVARGITPREWVESIHQLLMSQLPLDDLRVCFHDDSDDCLCRKPRPGLLLEAAKDHHIALETSYMIGDRWKDIEAGSRAGCKTILLKNHYNEKPYETRPNYIANSLIEAVEWIMRDMTNETHENE